MFIKYKFNPLIFFIFQLLLLSHSFVFKSFADDKFFKENLGENLFKENNINDLFNDEDIKKLLGGASYEAKQSWDNVPSDKLQCIKIGLKINNTSLDNLISEGIGPSDNKMSSYNKICSDILNQELRSNVSCKLNDEQGKSYYTKCNESFITISNNKIVKLSKLDAMKVMFNGGEVRTYKEITKEAKRKRQNELALKKSNGNNNDFKKNKLPKQNSQTTKSSPLNKDNLIPKAFSRASKCDSINIKNYQFAMRYFRQSIQNKIVKECSAFTISFTDYSALIFSLDNTIGYSPSLMADPYCVNTYTGQKYMGSITCRR